MNNKIIHAQEESMCFKTEKQFFSCSTQIEHNTASKNGSVDIQLLSWKEAHDIGREKQYKIRVTCFITIKIYYKDMCMYVSMYVVCVYIYIVSRQRNYIPNVNSNFFS